MATTIITGPKIYSEHGVLKGASLVIQDERISELKKSSTSYADACVYTFPAHYHVLPGFIDMHTHGIAGFDVMDGTHEAFQAIALQLAAEGTTAFLATTMTAEAATIERVLQSIHSFQSSQGAQLLGVHLEGPFIAKSKMGAQLPDFLIPPNVTLMQQWQAASGHRIKLVTLAPEQPESDKLIAYLKSQHIIASIGHTNATFDECQRAIAQGCTHATHLFNAMRGLHHREPGAVTAALLSDQVMVELIVDGVHLHPAIVSLTKRLKGADHILLVTDAMRAKCMKDGCYDLGGQEVHVKDGEAKLKDGTLAGSVLKMSSAIQNMLKFTGCELVEAIKMVAENPAKALGIFSQKGSIAEGKDADVVVLDESYRVVMTICRGKVAYSL